MVDEGTRCDVMRRDARWSGAWSATGVAFATPAALFRTGSHSGRPRPALPASPAFHGKLFYLEHQVAGAVQDELDSERGEAEEPIWTEDAVVEGVPERSRECFGGADGLDVGVRRREKPVRPTADLAYAG
jgi:hypothetical protein